MAEQPKYFDIEDTQTGKKYRVETDDPSATYEEAVEYFSTLPETDWQAFELKAPAKQAPAPAAVAPVSVASPAEEPSETDPYRPTPLDFNAGFTETFALESKDDPQVAALAESLWAQGIRDPEIYNKQIGKLRNNPEFSQFTNETIAQAREREAWYKARNLQTPGLFISSAPTGLEKEERPEGFFDTVGNALQRSAGQTYNSGVGLAALGADLVGADETSDSLLEEYILNNAKMELNLPRPVETYKDVDSFGAAGLYASDTLGEFAPQLVGSLGFGALGKEAAKRIVAKSADDFVESQVAAGATREAAEAAAKKYVDDVAQKGALAGAFVSTAPQEIGSTFGETYAATGEKAPAMSIAAGLTSASLDSILPAKILKNLSVSPQAITGKFRTELLKQGGKDFAMEGATEAAQEFIVSLPTSVIKGESPFTGEMLDRMTEAFIRGGIGGGTVGGTTATINYVRTAGANSLPVAAVEGNIVIPSGKKNTKAYREQLATAQDQIVDQVNSVAGKWTNAPDVEVHANFSNLDGIDNDAIGVYTTKTLEDGSTVPVIKINTEAVLARAKQRDVSPESVVEAVTFHEGLGHHGLTQLFREDLDAFLDDIYVNGAEEFRDKVDEWLRKNPSSYANYDPVSRRILATEEVLAGWSEKGPLPKTFVDNVLNLIKDFGRQMGVTFNINKLKDIKYTSREVRAYLAVANDRTVSGAKGGATPSAPRNMPWHGSPHTFAATENNPLGEFDHSKMGTGEGRQVFGWGTYLTDAKEIAASNYRDRLVRDRGVSLYGEQLSGDPRELKELLYSNFASQISSSTYRLGLPEFEGAQVITTWLSDLFTSGGGSAPGGKVTRQDFGDLYDDWGEAYGPEGWSEKNRDEFINALGPVRQLVNEAVSLEKSTGSLYDVALPDDAKWVEWEVPLNQQPELKKFLEDEGIEILDESSYKNLVKKNAGLSALLDPFSKTSQALYKANPAEYQAKIQEYREVSDTLDNSISEASLGRDVYDVLSRARGPEKASKALFNAGFTGNRYLADNLGQKKTRREDGSDVFNYVVFDDKTPKIVAKYMAGDGPLDPDQISADDLIEANNALDILNRLEYNPTVISPDQLESEAIARNLPPSDITRLVGLEPGKLMKKLFLYDVAATKLSDRAAKIKGDIDANGLTPERQLAYLETTFKLSELTAKIFDFQAEIGRTLAANRRVNFSRKRVKDLKTLLEQYGAEALADPETFMRYMAEIDAQAKGREKVTTTKDRVISIVNIPRAIMSSADLSAPLRQGVVFVSYPEYWKSFAKMFTMLGSSGERNYKFLMEKIAKHPNYELMQKARLAFSSLDGELSTREEDFQTELARKIPLFGKVVKASEQAYAGFLNKLRADMFNRFVEDYRKAGIEPDDETLKGIGKFVNAGTGRAELPEFLRPSSTIINATFFSGRLMYSRVQMLNPWFYAKLPPQVRKEAARSMLGFAGVAGLVAGSINALWPDDVETELDPRSSDFMKIKIDNTRFDIGGGFNQYLVLGARTATWMYNNSLAFTDRQLGTDVSEFQIANKITAGGDERKYGTDEFAQETLGGAIAQFLRSKLSPQASYFIDMINEQDVIGREFTVEGSLASRLVPMTASSIYDAYKEDSPVPMPVVFTATIFGVGVNTYTVPGMDPKKELKPPVTFDMKDLADGQNDLIRAEGGVVTLKPAARKRWEETLNNYYPFFVEEVAAEMGLKFEDMDDDMKKATVKEATKRARYNAKEDMMYELGLAE